MNTKIHADVQAKGYEAMAEFYVEQMKISDDLTPEILLANFRANNPRRHAENEHMSDLVRVYITCKEDFFELSVEFFNGDEGSYMIPPKDEDTLVQNKHKLFGETVNFYDHARCPLSTTTHTWIRYTDHKTFMNMFVLLMEQTAEIHKGNLLTHINSLLDDIKKVTKMINTI